MTIQSKLSEEIKSPIRRPRLFRWRGLLKLLSLVVVFAVGFTYAKMVTRFQAGQQLAIKDNSNPVPQSNQATKQSQVRSQNQVAIGRQPIHANPAIAQSNAAPQYAQFSNTPYVAVPTDTNKTTSQSKFNSTAPSSARPLKEASGFHLGSSPASTSAPTFGTQVSVAPANNPPNLSPTFAPTSGVFSNVQPSANVSWQNPTHNPAGQPTFIPAGQVVGSGFLQPATGTQQGGEVSSEEKVAEENILKLVGEIHQAKKSEKTELIEKLKAQILAQFKLRHAAQAKEIEELEKELEKAKTLHTKRNEKQDEIVERRFRQLMNELDDLDWNRGLKESAQQSSPLPVGPSVYYAQ